MHGVKVLWCDSLIGCLESHPYVYMLVFIQKSFLWRITYIYMSALTLHALCDAYIPVHTQMCRVFVVITKVNFYPNIHRIRLLVNDLWWLMGFNQGKLSTLDPGPWDVRTWELEDQGPEDPQFWELCCTAAVIAEMQATCANVATSPNCLIVFGHQRYYF